MSLIIEGPPLTWRWNNAFVPKSKYRSSSKFRFRDGEWWMDCRYESDVIHLYLCRDRKFPLEEDSPINAFIRVEDGNGNGQVLPELCDRKHNLASSGGSIWWRWEDDIERSYPEFKENRKLTFQVTIVETNAQTSSQPRCSLSNASTQTECATSNTVDSGTTNDTPTSSSTTNSNTADSSTSSSKPQTLLSTSTTICLVSLSEDFGKLLDEESYLDVEFHCRDFSTKAHRAVVSTRSPVLARMLKSDMVEGKTGIVEIKDMDVDTFKQFFQYLYSGKLDELTFEAAILLYEAADQYEVHGLASRCSEFITKNLSEENAYDVLIVADAHSDLKFVEVVVEYMVKNKFPLSSDQWSKFSDDQPRLAVKVLNRFCQNRA